MQKTLLIVPHFWDPICVPLGICSLKAYVEQFNHKVDLFDYNTVPKIFGMQRKYFEEGMRQFHYWQKWNIYRNGTDMLAFHQLAYLKARHYPNYRELVGEILNMSGRTMGQFLSELNTQPFDEIFDTLYRDVLQILEKLLNEFNPDVVGCYLNNSTWPATLFILENVKRLRPHVRTIVGGPGPIMGLTTDINEVKTFFEKHDFIDYFVIGEGEQSFLKILSEPSLPQGIIDSNAGLTLPEIKKVAMKMDDFPLPNYGNLEVHRYLMLSVSSSRGCPFECVFCAETVFWKGFRANKLQTKIYNDINLLANKYNRNTFYICESLSNHIITPLTKNVAANGKNYAFDCYLRADNMCTDENRTKIWAEGGLFRARLGLESASQRILDAMVKKTNPENMQKSLYALATQGVVTSSLWIVCFPGETEVEFNETLKFICENKGYIYQADPWLFQYHPKGLSKSVVIDSQKGSKYRFSDQLNDILAVSPYVVDNDLLPAERFERLERFDAALKEYDIPNPYSLREIAYANKRWQQLGHKSSWLPIESMKVRDYTKI